MKEGPKSQAERRAQTRRALLDATADVLIEKGFKAASIATIAKRAGLTTGAVQHHFSTKQALMRAVFNERIFNQDIKPDLQSVQALSLADRCKFIVTEQWRAYGDPKYIAVWNIILGTDPKDYMRSEIRDWQSTAKRAHEDFIMRVFDSVCLSKDAAVSIQYFVNAHLRGLAMLHTLEHETRIIDQQLDMLAHSLMAYIENFSR